MIFFVKTVKYLIMYPARDCNLTDYAEEKPFNHKEHKVRTRSTKGRRIVLITDFGCAELHRKRCSVLRSPIWHSRQTKV